MPAGDLPLSLSDETAHVHCKAAPTEMRLRRYLQWMTALIADGFSFEGV